MSTRFLVAKHVPDPVRMEPRNIGIVVWSNGELCSKFCGVDNGAIHVPSWIRAEDRHAYREWIDSWRLHLASQAIVRRTDGKRIEASSAEFLDVLKEKSKTQFMLTEGGVLEETLSRNELPDLAEELFARIVAKDEADVGEKASLSTLKERCASMFHKTRLTKEHVRQRRKLIGLFCDVQKYFDVDFAFGVSDGPTTAFMRVLPGRGNTTSIAYMALSGLKAINNGKRRYNTCALISRDLFGQQSAADLSILRRVSDIIDVTDRDAVQRAEELIGVNGYGQVSQSLQTPSAANPGAAAPP